MKVILNKDLAPLGEEGDVKEVAKGYARNFLFPRGIAMPYTERTVAILESRRGEIEARKEEKRKDALGLKEKLEELDLIILMPAGANGRLYGAVTSQTVADELIKQGFEIERKRIELPGNSFKSVGKYKVTVKLYESSSAELGITVEGQQLKVETPSAPARRGRRRRDEAAVDDVQQTTPESAADGGSAGPVAAEPGAADTGAAEIVPAPGIVETGGADPGVAETAAESAVDPGIAETVAADPGVAETPVESAADPGGDKVPEPVQEESAVEA
jgi:large subunit ribosomal protein L9